jgi:hypothetical protein
MGKDAALPRRDLMGDGGMEDVKKVWVTWCWGSRDEAEAETRRDQSGEFPPSRCMARDRAFSGPPFPFLPFFHVHDTHPHPRGIKP